MNGEEAIWKDNMLISKASISSLNKSIIGLYKELLLDSERDRLAGLNKEGFLKEINAAGTDEEGNLVPTVAGLLMFGSVGDIRNIFPNFFLDYRQLCSENLEVWNYRMTSDIGLYCGNIFEFYIKTSRLLNGHSKIKGMSVETAVKEALANALIHADYTERRGIIVKVSDNYLEISNPGNILVGEGQFFKGGISDPRNPLVFHMFTRIGTSDRAGKGVRKILEAWHQQGWPQPSCSVTEFPARVELHMRMSE